MLHERHDEAIALGERAAALARALGDDETLAHALTNVGTSLIGGADHERGRALLEEAHRIAVAIGHDEHAGRALVNLATRTFARRRDDPRIPDDIERALAFVRDHELDGYHQYMLGVRANLQPVRRDWPAAEADARASLALGEQPGVSLCPALIALGRLQSRRGDPEAAATLDEAWRVAVADRRAAAPRAASPARAPSTPGSSGELDAEQLRERLRARRRARRDLVARRGRVLAAPRGRRRARPPRRSRAARPRGRRATGAARRRRERAIGLRLRGRANALLGDEEATVEALAMLRRARRDPRRRAPAPRACAPTACAGSRAARAPPPARRPDGLTPRETEVLAQLRTGATNAEIAARW